MALPALTEIEDANWDFLKTNAIAWTALATTWEAVFTEIRDASVSPGGTPWTGAGAEAFQHRAAADVVQVHGPADMLRNAAAIANRAAEAQQSNKALVLSAVDAAERDDFRVGDDYSVTDTYTYYSSAAEQVQREQAAERHSSFIKSRAHNLVNHEADIARRLTTATTGLHEFGFGDEGADGGAGGFDGAGGPGAAPDDPQQFTQWWNQLTQVEKDAAYDRDHFVGNHPGMPFEDKTHYNRLHLPELMTGAQAEVDRLQAGRDQLALTPGGNLSTLSKLGVLDPQLQDAKRRLDGYRAVEHTLNADPDGPSRYLGYLDDQGHAAISIGNPDTASRNAVLVPGTGQDLTAIGGATDKSMAMYNAAHAADTDLHPGDVAVTTWMAYDRPMSLPEAAHTDYARNGAAGLDSFEAGMRASHIGDPSRDTVIGHSYGSTLVGAAATDGHRLAADNVIAVGSPGMLAGYAGDLNLNPGAEVFAARANNDIIDVVTGLTLGPDPASLAFSAVRLEADPGPPGFFGIPGTSIDAHSSYWSQGNRALLNFGAVIAGVQPPYVVGPLGSVIDIPPQVGG